MELLLLVVLGAVLAAAAWSVRGLVIERAQIMEWEQGLLFANGRFDKMVGPPLTDRSGRWNFFVLHTYLWEGVVGRPKAR